MSHGLSQSHTTLARLNHYLMHYLKWQTSHINVCSMSAPGGKSSGGYLDFSSVLEPTLHAHNSHFSGATLSFLGYCCASALLSHLLYFHMFVLTGLAPKSSFLSPLLTYMEPHLQWLERTRSRCRRRWREKAATSPVSAHQQRGWPGSC